MIKGAADLSVPRTGSLDRMSTRQGRPTGATYYSMQTNISLIRFPVRRRRLLTLPNILFVSFIICSGVTIWNYYLGYDDDYETLPQLDSLWNRINDPDGTDSRRATPSPQPPKRYVPHHTHDVADVIDDNLMQMLADDRTNRMAMFIFCDDFAKFDYVNYLSLASVLRFFAPSSLRILHTGRTETLAIEPGANWTTSSTVDELLGGCRAFNGTFRMKNASVICLDDKKRHEFIMKTLIHHGGVYVGPRTIMSPVAARMRADVINEDLVGYLRDDCEGFVYVKAGLKEPVEGTTQSPVLATEKEDQRVPQDSDGPKIKKVKYFTSMELKCFQHGNVLSDALHTNEGKVYFPCFIVPPTSNLSPALVNTVSSDFGVIARKIVYGERDAFWSTSDNSGIAPSLCNQTSSSGNSTMHVI